MRLLSERAAWPVLCFADQMTDCQGVAVSAESRDDAFRYGAGVRMVAKAFSFVNIADVDFDGIYPAAANGISQSDAGMRVGCRVENDPVDLFVGKTGNGVDELAFVI